MVSIWKHSLQCLFEPQIKMDASLRNHLDLLFKARGINPDHYPKSELRYHDDIKNSGAWF